MKISRVSTLCLSRPHELDRQWMTSRYRTIKADCAVVVMDTDEGLRGIGEASAYGWPLMIRRWVDWLSPALLGRDPLDPAIVPHPNGLSRSHDAAAAGLDIALWDLKGQLAQAPVKGMLAENPIDRVRLYASGGCQYDWRNRPERLIEEALAYIDMGYTAMKFRLGTEWAWDGVTVDRFLALVRELAAEVNGRMDLMLDGNCRLSEAQALAIALEVDRLGFAWFEEPLPHEDIDGYARLCESVRMPISGGESFSTLEQFRPYMEHQAYDIVQPDAGLCGITEGMRIAEMAHRYGIRTCPHSWHNGLMAMANAHLVAALPAPYVLELCMHQGPLQWEILEQKPTIHRGWLTLPDQPGLGVKLADRVEERFPYVEGHYALQVTR